MRLALFTIVRDGMPWITMHYPELRRLPPSISWTWTLVEGTAAPAADTSWCAPQAPGLSTDGTREYLDALAAADPRIVLIRSEWWHGKTAMVNAALATLFEPALLLEVDADELWRAEQLVALVELFAKHPRATAAYFYCRYFVGRDLVLAGRSSFGNHADYEWLRAWRFSPGQRFRTHEPPVLDGCDLSKALTHAETERAALVFDHLAWATEAQVAFKCRYYGTRANKKGHLYANALEGWKRLQRVSTFPVAARDYLPFIEDASLVDHVSNLFYPK